jgi:molecular chaperone HtpG
LLDQDKAQEIVDPTTNKTKSEVIKELFEKALNKPKVNIRTEALKSDDPQGTPPAIVLLPEFLRRMREMSAMMQQQNADFPEDHILLVNTAHPLIQNLVNLNQGTIIQGEGQTTNPLANLICQHVYDLALMSQKGFDAEGMKSFVERSNDVLTKLTQQASN